MGKTTANGAGDNFFTSVNAAGLAMLQNPQLTNVIAKNDEGRIIPLARVEKSDRIREDELRRFPIPTDSNEKVTVAHVRAPRS